MSRKSLLVLGVLLIAIGLSLALLPPEWIEEAVGFEPDGGNGLIELLLAAVPLVAGGLLVIKAIAIGRRRSLVGRRSPV